MPDTRFLKRRSIFLIGTTQPNPCVITLLLLLVSQMISFLSLRIGGQPFVIDFDALSAMDAENAVRFVPENMTGISSAFMLAFQILMLLLNYGFYSYCLHACREEKCGFGDLLDGFVVAFKAILLELIRGILFFCGTVLFIIPGIIFLFAYEMAPYILLEHPDWSVLRCLRESRLLMRGRKLRLFLFHLSFIGWILLSIIPLVSVFSRPYIQLAETGFYLTLTGGSAESDKSEDPPADEKPPWEY